MKVFVCVNNYSTEKSEKNFGWYFLADSAVSNTGKPFFLPEDSGMVSVSLAPAVRISRLGKFIAPKFASRYFSEWAPALHFYLPELENNLRLTGLPQDPAWNFDRSLFVYDFIPFRPEDNFTLLKNGEESGSFSLPDLLLPIEEVIARVSRLNTVKMGDILLPALGEGVSLKSEDLLEVMINGQKAFHVKVK